ncbi:MAG TPA: lytic transglycosylase domain-containing protein [Blastocatellia bacterium]|nr:lytic transglycosylase domain-containing protein [Blastocatellia bacterium]
MRKRILKLFVLALIAVAGAFVAWHYWTHRYDSLIVAVAQKHGLDPLLVKAVVYEESFFIPRAQSSQKAVGLMQVTPVVAQELMEVTRSRSLREAIADVSGSAPPGDPSFEEALSDPTTSLHVGCWYLQTLLNRYRDEPEPLAVALAAYNAGPSNVERWASNADRSNLSRDEFISRIQFPVTRDYVKKIIERYDYYKRDQDIEQ